MTADNSLQGNSGNDRLFSGAGNDVLSGATGIDYALYSLASTGVDRQPGVPSTGRTRAEPGSIRCKASTI